MSFCVLQHKVVTDEYPTVSAFLADVELLLSNSRLFYPSTSDEASQVDELEAGFTRVLSEYGFGVGLSTPSSSSESSSSGGNSRRSSESDSIKSPLTLRIPKAHLKLTPTVSSAPSLSSPATATVVVSSGGYTPIVAPARRSTLDSAPHSRRKTDEKGVFKSVVSVKGKVTRSQAWIQEYLESDDPLKIYLATIYDYHDNNTGEYVAEPFLQLPSRTLYPEYYKIITQPMDLATIRKNTEVKGHQPYEICVLLYNGKGHRFYNLHCVGWEVLEPEGHPG